MGNLLEKLILDLDTGTQIADPPVTSAEYNYQNTSRFFISMQTFRSQSEWKDSCSD